MTKKEILK